ncbi:MAG TPA: YqgE/AlgH family protein [Prolixibacteraceae bacterium]|nr:YqgE/AlgH family protein [Prolixibacteraceae bacterium]HPR60336.1 YqgE/AlgH family protein [Prolixibacteraceae bacterium]
MNLNLDIFKIKSNNVAPEKGKILIAEPFLPGSYFNRSIVFLVEHNANGSVGFILNKPVNFQINEFYKEFPNYNDKIYIGGPVNIESLFFIHKLGDRIKGSVPIINDLWWGGDFDDLKQLMNDGQITNNQIRFFLGYSGWDKGQLKEELKEDSWIVSDIAPNLVINGQNELWHDMVKSLGGKYRLWENFPENPGMN